jgi:hypothetical protein
MNRQSVVYRFRAFVFFVAIAELFVHVPADGVRAQPPDSKTETANPKFQTQIPMAVLIIKAAGYLEGQKPEGPDAVTEATSAGGNTHLFADKLRGEFIGLGREAEIIAFNDSTSLKQRLGPKTGVRLVIFAGPTYSSTLPQQLSGVVSKYRRILIQDSILCTSLTSCRFLDSGRSAVGKFNEGMEKTGMRTAEGLAVLHEFSDENWASKLKAFAIRLSDSR